MARNIKGITIEINGDTKGLDKALSSVNSSANKTQSELRDVNKLLKLDPGNTELIAQKQKLLAQAITQTGDKLKTLKDAQAQVDAQFAKGDIGEEQYRAFQREIASTEATLKGYKSQLSTAANSQQELSQSTQRLQNYFKATGTSVDDFKSVLGTRLVNAIKSGTASSESLDRALQQIAKESGVASSDMSELSQALSRVDDGGSIDNLKSELTGLQNKSKDTGDQLDKIVSNTFSEKVQNVGDAMSDIGGKVSELGKSMIDSWSEMDDSVDNLTSKTGATGEAADKLSESYEKVERSLAGSQMESRDLSDTMAELSSTFGLSGKQLETTSEYVSKFSQVTGQSGTEAVEALRSTLGKFNIKAKEIPSVLDAFTAASQSSGVSVADLENDVADAQPVFSQLGISLTDGVSVIAKWSKAGLDSSTSIKAMTKASSTYAASGKTMKQGLTDTFNAIKKTTDPTKQLNAAVEAFGTKAGPKMLAAIKDNKVSLGDLTASASSTGGTVKKSFDQTVDPIDKAKQAQVELQQKMAELGGEILKTLAPALKKIVDFAKQVADWFGKLPGPVKDFIVAFGGVTVILGILAPIIAAFVMMGSTVSLIALGIAAAIAVIVVVIKNWGKIVDWIKGVWSDMVNNVKAIWNDLILSINIGIANFQIWWSNIWTAIKQKVSDIWNGIKTMFSNVVNAIVTTVSNKFNEMKNGVSNIFNAIKSVATSVWNAIKSAISSVVNGIKSTVTNIWNGIKSVTSSVFNAVKSTASSVWNGIKSTISSVVNGIKSTVSGVWNGIKSVTTSVWNGIKSAITSPIQAAHNVISGIVNRIKSLFNFRLKFPSVDIPHIPLPHFSLSGSFNPLKGKIPHIGVDWYAKGGVFTKPTLFANNGGFSGVGEAGPEAALPLNAKTLGGIGKGIADTMGNLGNTFSINIYPTNDMSQSGINQMANQMVEAIKNDLLLKKNVSNMVGTTLARGTN